MLEAKHKQSCSKKIYKQLQKERVALETLELSAVQRKLHLLKQRTWTKSPQSLRYLAWKLKKQTRDRAVLALASSKGQLTSDPITISNLFADFYRKLYTTESPQHASISAYFKRPGLGQRLASIHREALDQPITTTDVLSAIKRLKIGKSPGRDGFPSEFYKAFSASLTQPLVELYNSIQDSGLNHPHGMILKS